MKTPALLLTVSLLANGALVAALVLTAPARRSASAVTPTAAAVAVRAAGSSSAAAVNVPVANLWSRLHDGNFDEFSRRLRAAGFPARVVRSMLNVAIGEETNARRDALIGKREDLPYWKYPYQSERDPAQQLQLNEIYQDGSALAYKYANGPAILAEDEDERIAAQRRFGNLPVEKLQQLTALNHDLDAKRNKLYAEMTMQNAETVGPKIRESADALEKAAMAEVRNLLTPEEFEQYSLRNYASGLRMQLSAFRPSEEEFKALYAIQRQMGEQPTPASDPASREAAYLALREQQKALTVAALGPERYADFEIARDGSNNKLAGLITRLDLPLSTITTINTVRSDINQRAQIINNDQQLTAAQREAQLAGLAQEANERMTSTLGQRGYDAYADMKGDWIRALKPKKK